MCARVPVHVHQRVSSVWVQSRVRVHTWVFTRVDVCICVPVHTCVYVRSVWRQVSVSIHACLHVRMHASVHACLFPWLGACMCLCAHSVYKRLHTLWVYACALCAHMHVYTHGGICINVCVRPEVNPPPATARSPPHPPSTRGWPQGGERDLRSGSHRWPPEEDDQLPTVTCDPGGISSSTAPFTGDRRWGPWGPGLRVTAFDF